MNLKNLLLTFGICCTTVGSALSIKPKITTPVNAGDNLEITTNYTQSLWYQDEGNYYFVMYGTSNNNGNTVQQASYTRVKLQPIIQIDRTTKYKPIIDTYTFSKVENSNGLPFVEYQVTYSNTSYDQEDDRDYTITYYKNTGSSNGTRTVTSLLNDSTLRTEYTFTTVQGGPWQSTTDFTTNDKQNSLTTSSYMNFHTHEEKTTNLLTEQDLENFENAREQYVYIELWDIKVTLPVTTNITISNETHTDIVDIPGLMMQIISMPFTFISTAFNVTLFPGTQYQVNIGNFILGIIAILTLLFIIKIFTGGLDIIGNVTNSARDNSTERIRRNTAKVKSQRKNTAAKNSNKKAKGDK